MTPHQIVTVAVRFFALAWLLYVVSGLPALFTYRDVNANALGSAAIYGTVVMQLGMCAVLWMLPALIARKLLPAYVEEGERVVPSSPNQWYTLIVLAVGFWVLVDAINDGVYYITLTNYINAKGGQFKYLNPDAKAGIVSSAASFAGSILLIIFAKRIGQLFGKGIK